MLKLLHFMTQVTTVVGRQGKPHNDTENEMDMASLAAANTLMNRIMLGNELLIMQSFSELIFALGYDVVYNPDHHTDAQEPFNQNRAVEEVGSLVVLICRGYRGTRIKQQIQLILFFLDQEAVTCPHGI